MEIGLNQLQKHLAEKTYFRNKKVITDILYITNIILAVHGCISTNQWRKLMTS